MATIYNLAKPYTQSKMYFLHVPNVRMASNTSKRVSKSSGEIA
jgi:hypothetical protein